MANYKEASMLSADPLSWGMDIITELITRLPKIQPFILEDRVVYHDPNGNGLVLIVLEFANGKAFVPAVVKEWKCQPLDIVMYKDKHEVKYKYLSERNLINLATYIGLGSGIRPRTPGFMSPQSVGLNVTAPANAGTVGSPTTGGVLTSKSASIPLIPHMGFVQYAQKLANETTTFWHNTSLEPIINPPDINIDNHYKVLVRNINGTHDLYSDRSDIPLSLTTEQTATLLEAAYPEPALRQEKAASYLKTGTQVMGSIIPREGNIILGQKDTASAADNPQHLPLPLREGMFEFNNQITYCNPLVTYLGGEPYSYALAVQPGRYTLTKNIEGFNQILAADASELSKDDLLPQAHPDKLIKGQTITLYDGRDGTVTIPCLVEHVSRTSNNILIKVKPLFGPSVSVNILFYRGQLKKFDPLNPTVLLVPFVETQVLLLPSFAEKGFDDPVPATNNRGIAHQVSVSKGGNYSYSVKEDGHFVKTSFNYGALVYRLIRRYGFGEAQAAKFIKSLDTERVKNMEIKFFLDEATTIAVPADKITPEEKEIAQKFASVSEGLFQLNKGMSFDLVKSGSELDIKFEYILDSIHKEAADDPTPAQPSKPGFMDFAGKQTPVAKDTQELIDLLTYYSLGKFKGDEASEVLTKLEESLKEAEGFLCKILLLTEMGRIPGHHYSDVKVLLSDMDSYISSIVSSRVLLKSGIQ